jgi:hypothetical protein
MRTVASVLVVVAGACGSGSSSKPDAAEDKSGFTPPSDVLHAWDNTGATPVDLGPADLTCLDTPTSDQATTVAVTLNTIVLDFYDHHAISGANVTAFDGIAYMSPFATQTSGADGKVAFTIPAGRTRFGFEMTAVAQLPTLLLNQYLNPDPGMTTQMIEKIQSVSTSTATTLTALIGETRVPGTGVLAGALRDCQHHELSNFTATVSTTQGTATPLTGAETYYFNPGLNAPGRHSMYPSSTSDGLFVVLQLPTIATGYVQMWGFPAPADLTSGQMKLIAELAVPVVADTVITGSYEPLRK